MKGAKDILTHDLTRPEELEELVAQIVCWLKKWAFWDDSSTIYSREKAFSGFSGMADFFGMAERKQSGWRNQEDVWAWDYRFEELGENLQMLLNELGYVLVMDCSDSLSRLFAQGTYSADFDSLPDAAQVSLLHRMDLFELCEDWWYERYLEEGVRFEATEFDSFDEYWELESENQEEFKLEQFKNCLREPRLSNGYNEEAAKLIRRELDEILKSYRLLCWTNASGDIAYIG